MKASNAIAGLIIHVIPRERLSFPFHYHFNQTHDTSLRNCVSSGETKCDVLLKNVYILFFSVDVQVSMIASPQ